MYVYGVTVTHWRRIRRRRRRHTQNGLQSQETFFTIARLRQQLPNNFQLWTLS